MKCQEKGLYRGNLEKIVRFSIKNPVTLYCPKCGAPNANQSSFCETCLSEVPSYLWDKMMKCPECRYENPVREEFCERCHELLRPGQYE